MENFAEYIVDISNQLNKAIAHLEYSYQKILKLSSLVEEMDDEVLETWESFAARFSRVADIFLVKYIKARVKAEDPGFTGTFRDFLNQAEKLALVEDTNIWMKIRELRNVAAHEYTENNLSQLFEKLKNLTPTLIAIKSLLS